MRAMVELAHRDTSAQMDQLAEAQEIPPSFLRGILAELRRAGLLASQSGPSGGYRLARPASQITIAQIIRAVEGPLAQVRGLPPNEVAYPGPAAPMQDVWIAVRANLRAVLEHVTLADLRDGALTPAVDALAEGDDAWALH